MAIMARTTSGSTNRPMPAAWLRSSERCSSRRSSAAILALAGFLAQRDLPPQPGHGDDGDRVEILYVERCERHRRLHRQGRFVLRVRERPATGTEGFDRVVRAIF